MSVYAKEHPAYLRCAISSMLGQTVAPSEIVVVEDGILGAELQAEIERFDREHPGLFKIVAYPENRGLGYALRRGVLACGNQVIARMDSDDYAYPSRMERQLALMERKHLDMVGSQVREFVDRPDQCLAMTNLPESYEQIVAYSKRRNPFRHPPIVFRRDRVLEAGNYTSEFLYFEDWDLFNRMLAHGFRAENIHEPLVAMRVSAEFYARRGGLAYLLYAWKFKYSQYRRGYFSLGDLVLSFAPQMAVCLMPNALRSLVYLKLLRA